MADDSTKHKKNKKKEKHDNDSSDEDSKKHHKKHKHKKSKHHKKKIKEDDSARIYSSDENYSNKHADKHEMIKSERDELTRSSRHLVSGEGGVTNDVGLLDDQGDRTDKDQYVHVSDDKMASKTNFIGRKDKASESGCWEDTHERSKHNTDHKDDINYARKGDEDGCDKKNYDRRSEGRSRREYPADKTDTRRRERKSEQNFDDRDANFASKSGSRSHNDYYSRKAHHHQDSESSNRSYSRDHKPQDKDFERTRYHDRRSHHSHEETETSRAQTQRHDFREERPHQRLFQRPPSDSEPERTRDYNRRYHHSQEETQTTGAQTQRHDFREERPHQRAFQRPPSDSEPASYTSQGAKVTVKEKPDHSFDFSQHKLSLNRIFFRDTDAISRGSKEYEDFWVFLAKYQAFQKKKAEKGGEEHAEGKADHDSNPQEEAMSESLGIPRNYDRRYRINLCLMSREAEDFIKKGRLVDYQVDEALTRARVQQFRSVLLHYLDFCQKQKFQKLRKIRHDQKNLPIHQYKEKIVSMIQQHQIVVVAGDTGCGKSTQMPQYLLEAGFEHIACTQPRRIACISLAKRVSYETLNEYGSQVAYQVRFEKTKTSHTRILFLTEGLLLRQMSGDQLLDQYSVIVIDEVHERHIHTDFLLGVLKCLLKMRSDLKLVLMSATINISLFSDYFDKAPVIKVPGRLYPIEMEYCPLNKNTELYNDRPSKLDPAPYIRIMQRIDSKYPPSERGDMLVFLSGMTEIMTVVEAAKLYGQQVKSWIILPLHSALSVEEQEKVFDYPPEGVRKCIVSTNIAETSVTIDGVRFVVDSGKVKEMSFDPKYKMQRLKEFWISRASSEQRKGRAGRTGPGVCFRLYAESVYDEFQAYTTPEIQRVPLDALVLQLISMGLPNVRKFPFIEPPDMATIETSVRFLKEQGALAEDESLTSIGQMLSMLPVDVVIGKMLIMGSIFHMIDPVLSIAAAMSVQSPFTGKAHIDQDAIGARKSIESEHGDPLTLLNAFDEWIRTKAEGRGTQKWCKRRCLEEQRFYEMTKLKRQFRDLLKDHHLLDDGGDRKQAFTSEERRQRHGERKRLGQLKREQNQDRKRRKVLTMEDEDFALSDKEEEQGEDVKDLEFRLTHDLNQLQEKSNRSRSFTLKDINMLKVILCSGIFPQVALADDCNAFKGPSDQAFHTKNKPFILIHPTSIFSYQPDLLKPSDLPEKHSGPTELRGRLGSRHELLTYSSLLETNGKPYLVNCMRVPALQTLTLFTNSIDTNGDCTRLVCDGWLEVRFPDAESAEQVLSAIISLRGTWLHLLQLRLEDTFQGMEEERETSPRARKLERVLSRKLAEFVDSKVPYALRRVLAAEMQHIYVGPGNKAQLSAGMKMFVKDGEEVTEHPVKGGIQVNAYLTYNCLLDEASASMWGQYTSHMQRHWTCPKCRQSMIASVLERLRHEDTCQHDETQADGSVDFEDVKEDQCHNPLKKAYFCGDCDKTLRLTATEILKHKKSHASATDQTLKKQKLTSATTP